MKEEIRQYLIELLRIWERDLPITREEEINRIKELLTK